jgi:hypothetical protein
MIKIIAILLFLIVGVCRNSYAELSLKNGDNKFVTCFFNSGEIYKDIVFDVRWDKKSKSSEFIILPSSKFDSNVLSATENRLSIHFINNFNRNVLLNIFFSSGRFEMKDEKYEGSGVCEEKL